MEEEDPPIIATVALASAADPKDPLTNTNVTFQISVDKDSYGSVANSLRVLLEDSHSSCYLPYICNRVLEESTMSHVAIELIYGNGYRTFIKRKDGPELKSYKQIPVNLCIGAGAADEEVHKLPILMPDDDLYTHLANSLEPELNPTIYIRTGGPLFSYPIRTDHQTCITLNVPNKRGYWAGGVYEGTRGKYPSGKEIPSLQAGSTAARKRKATTDKPAGATKDDKKKDDDDDDDDDEEKPKKKAKKNPTPKKKEEGKKGGDDKDVDDEEEILESDKKEEKKKDEKKEEEKKKDEKKKKTPSKRKSDASSKESSSKKSKEGKEGGEKKRKSTGSTSKKDEY